MNASKFLLLSAYFFVAVLALSEDHEYYTYQKKGAREFSLGPRYGRTKEDAPIQRGKLHMVPRSEQFYLGPRYGKRSSDPPETAAVHRRNQQPPCFNDNDFSCDYTGVSNLYRCFERNEWMEALVKNTRIIAKKKWKSGELHSDDTKSKLTKMGKRISNCLRLYNDPEEKDNK